nr:MAG TPA: hypothetical protein [Caudoviricetes sp.]
MDKKKPPTAATVGGLKMNSLPVVGNPSSQMDYTTFRAGFSSHTLEVFFIPAESQRSPGYPHPHAPK